MQGKLIGRRGALKYFGLLGATAAGCDFLASWLPQGSDLHAARPLDGETSGESDPASFPADSEPYAPRFFKPDEFPVVAILTEMMIPSDDQPGAKEAKVANYIDFVVYSAGEFEPSLQKTWVDGLVLVERVSREQYKGSFSEITASQREKLLTEMSLPERDPAAQHPGFEFYHVLKEMTVEAFYTSKIGLKGVLGYKGLTFLTEFPGCTHPEHKV